MVEMIKKNKDEVLRFMEQEIGKYGNGRMDVKQIGELADIVKDLAAAEESCWEAEYYRTVTEAMEHGGGSSGYSGSPANGGNMMGYGMGGNRRGYGSDTLGHSDPIAAIRDMLATANPEMRAQIRNEFKNLM